MLASDPQGHRPPDGSPNSSQSPARFRGENKRRSKRSRPAAKEIAAIYVGGNRYSGELLDQSAGGFAVLLGHDAEIRTGVRVRIAARLRCSAAVVVRCETCEQGHIVGLRVT
jgi:hypothetical protein